MAGGFLLDWLFLSIDGMLFLSIIYQNSARANFAAYAALKAQQFASPRSFENGLRYKA